MTAPNRPYERILPAKLIHVHMYKAESDQVGDTASSSLSRNCYYVHSVSMLLLLLSRFGCVRLCATPETAAHQAPPPWDSPGKNTVVGCHCLLQCMKVKSEREVAQSGPTLSDPMDCSLQGSSIRGIFQARVLQWGAIAFSWLLNAWMSLLIRQPIHH